MKDNKYIDYIRIEIKTKPNTPSEEVEKIQEQYLKAFKGATFGIHSDAETRTDEICFTKFN